MFGKIPGNFRLVFSYKEMLQSKNRAFYDGKTKENKQKCQENFGEISEIPKMCEMLPWKFPEIFPKIPGKSSEPFQVKYNVAAQKSIFLFL